MIIHRTKRSVFQMRVAALSVVLVAGSAAVATFAKPQAAPSFTPPKATNVGSIGYPSDPSASGMVKFQLSVGTDGNLDSVQRTDGGPPIAQPAMDSLINWKFANATLDNNGVVAPMFVYVLFNPSGPAARSATIDVGTAVDFKNNPDYVPPQLTSASYAMAPSKIPAANAIALNVRIGATGQVEDVSPVTPNPALAAAATAAVKSWKFSPGKYKGAATAGSVVVAFVFRPSESAAAAPARKS